MLREKYGEDWRQFLTDFITYLTSTTDASWCVDVVRREQEEESNCLFGHLSNFCKHEPQDDVSPDFDWFEIMVATTYMVYPVNDGANPDYPQTTPRLRCIALMEAFLSGKELTTLPGMDAEWERYKEKNNEEIF